MGASTAQPIVRATEPCYTFAVTRKAAVFGLQAGDRVILDLAPNAVEPLRLQRTLPTMTGVLLDLLASGVLRDVREDRTGAEVSALIRFLCPAVSRPAVSAPVDRGRALRLVKDHSEKEAGR